MERDAFHAGYLVEHILSGGVWVILQGMLLENGEVRPLPQEGRAFKVIRRTGQHIIHALPSHMAGVFIELVGVWAGQEHEAFIFHLGGVWGREGDDDRCAGRL